MASELYVETLKGLTSGANANKVIVPAGQTLDASAGTFTPSSGQVVQTVMTRLLQDPNQFNSNSTTFADTGHTATITPTSTSSLIYVQLLTTIEVDSDINQAARVKLFRDSTEIFYSQNIFYTSVSAQDFVGAGYCFAHVDTPSTTSAVTYKTQFAMRESSSTGAYNKQDAQFLIMEIAG